ncbi:hypothetical protein ABBQ32_013802 [Trebouxia sp. C0010 RCD-2024]
MQALLVFPGSTAPGRMSGVIKNCTSLNAGLQSSCTHQLARSILQHRPALTLERAVGEKTGLDSELWAQAPFVAGVVPDLPVLPNASWKQLGARLLTRQVAAPQVVSHEKEMACSNLSDQGRRCRVQTVAAQVQQACRSCVPPCSSACLHQFYSLGSCRHTVIHR